MSPPPTHDPVAALNQVLSEVIDEVQTVKQAHRKVPETHAFHALLDRLSESLRDWAQLLIAEDEVLGVSPLTSMPSVAGRRPPNLWPGDASDEEVRRVMADHLDRLAEHVAAALADQDDERARTVLAEVERGLLVQRQTFSQLA